MRVLVTGGAGFLGSHLCDALIEQGHEVICLDNLFSSSKENIKHLIGHDRFEFIRHDVCEQFRLEVDQIYHLACPASPVFYQFNPIGTTKTNVLGTLNVLGLARRTKARVLLASTSEVYGNPLEHPQTETYWGNVNPIGVRSCYDEGKRVAETLCFDYMRQEGVEIRVARIFNSYGPRMMEDDGRVVSNFVVQALKNEDITVYGDGSQTRSFCYCKDTVRGLMKLMNSDTVGPCNIGMPKENTVLELAQAILKHVGETSSNIVHEPLPSDDPVRRLPDISRAKKELQWEPFVDLDEGIKDTVDYFRANLGKRCSDIAKYKHYLKRQQIAALEKAQHEAHKEGEKL